jgi:hypothetical protein
VQAGRGCTPRPGRDNPRHAKRSHRYPVTTAGPATRQKPGTGNNGARNRVRPSSLLNTAGKGQGSCVRSLLAGAERIGRRIGRDAGFAAPVAFSGEQVPGPSGLGQLVAAAELPEVQVRLGYPAPAFSPPIRAGGRLRQGHLWELVRRLARAAGIQAWAQLSPHCLRHSAITFALDAGATLRDVQDYAGHKDPRTTRRYDHARDSLDRNAAYAVAAYLA